MSSDEADAKRPDDDDPEAEDAEEEDDEDEEDDEPVRGDAHFFHGKQKRGRSLKWIPTKEFGPFCVIKKHSAKHPNKELKNTVDINASRRETVEEAKAFFESSQVTRAIVYRTVFRYSYTRFFQLRDNNLRICISDSKASRGKQMSFKSTCRCSVKGCKKQFQVAIPHTFEAPGDVTIKIEVLWNGEKCRHNEEATSAKKARDGLTEAQKNVVQAEMERGLARGQKQTAGHLWNFWPTGPHDPPNPPLDRLTYYFGNHVHRKSRRKEPDSMTTVQNIGTSSNCMCIIFTVLVSNSVYVYQISYI